jgi:hypothetical protein
MQVVSVEQTRVYRLVDRVDHIEPIRHASMLRPHPREGDRLGQRPGLSLEARRYGVLVSDRQGRVVSDLDTSYLSAEALADDERLGIELADGQPLTACDYDADENGNPTWLVAQGVARFDPERKAWQVAYTMDDVHWEPRNV